MLRTSLILGSCLLASSSVFAQTVIVDEDFESYADTAALLAAWPAFNPSNGFHGDNGTLLTSDPGVTGFYPTGINASGTEYDFTEFFADGAAEFCGGHQDGDICGVGLPQGGGTVNRWMAPFSTPVVPSETENVVLTADIFDDAFSANKRLTVGLRNTANTQNLVELGLYNNPAGFVYRAQLFGVTGGNTNPNWVSFGDTAEIDSPLPADLNTQTEVGAGFHRFQAIIGVDQITFSLDLYADGMNNADPENPVPGVDAFDTVSVITSANGFDDLRFGIPSHLPSSGGNPPGNPDAAFAAFDNIRLELVPVTSGGDNADFNGNNLVEGDDFLIWQAVQPINDGTALPGDGDANDDGNVNELDLAAWQSQYGAFINAPVSSVPEPTTVLLSLLAAGWAQAAMRRR